MQRIFLIISLLLCGCTQSNNKTTANSNPLKDSIAINTFMNFKLGASRNQTLEIIDSLINTNQIENCKAVKNKFDRFGWNYTATSVYQMEERLSFEGSIIAKGESGQYNKYRADVELQFYRDTLYSVFVYPARGYYFDGLNYEGVCNMFTNKYSAHYTLNTYGPTTLYDYYVVYWLLDKISKYTSYSANSKVWEFKTSTIGVSTLTYEYTDWEFDASSFKRAIEYSSYAHKLYDLDEYDHFRLSKVIFSKAIALNRKQESSDLMYFWYRNDVIQERLNKIEAEKEEKLRQYQIEQQNKCKEESNKLQEQFQKQAI